MKNILSFIIRNKGILFVALTALILRFFNLGYSDFQGDEIKALYIPDNGENFLSYLMDQRKGPIQFFITFLIKFIDPNYRNMFLIRFPFAFAGFLSVIVFYKFVELYFTKRTAFFASLLLVSNGFFVAFSRIVQYQSFVIFFMIISLYFFSLATKKKEWEIKGIYLGFLSWALCLLSHYDGIFIAPFCFYILFIWFKQHKDKNYIKHLLGALFVSGILLGIFYIPFIFNLTKATKDYWQGRLTGEISGKISSTPYLFSVYQPIYSYHFYLFMSVAGFICIFLFLIRNKFRIANEVAFQDGITWGSLVALICWLLVGFVFMEIVVSIPGTHIYIYLLPLIIICGLGLMLFTNIIEKVFHPHVFIVFISLMLGILMTFLYLQSYFVFVDNNQEYPWEEEKFLIWTFPKPNPSYNLSLFGFPYYRNWQGISDFAETKNEIKAYSCNERKTITRFYIPLEKNADKAGLLIYIKNPQNFIPESTEEKVNYWISKYEPVYTFSRQGDEIVRVYIMEPGTLKEIKAKGF